ncbi:MAG: alpha/beta fold hydrolase [Thermoguttaceae bacterium]|nr:alpha/beta fold hydrolase [Thermoguttaceae bacterium]
MKLNYEKRGTSPTVLLLGHGFPFDRRMWEAQLAGLSDEFTVLAPDLRGMGKSAPSGATLTTMADMADDLAELLDSLGIEKCTYCGLSMGGYVGLEFWSRHAARLERFILCDSNVRCDTQEAAANRLLTAERIEKEASCAFLAEGMKKNLMTDATLRAAEDPNGVYSVYHRMVSENSPQGVAAAARGMAQRRDFTQLVTKFEIPVLILTGELDVLSPPSAMEELARTMPEAELAVIPNAAHLAPMEQPEAVDRAIRAFLRN